MFYSVIANKRQPYRGVRPYKAGTEQVGFSPGQEPGGRGGEARMEMDTPTLPYQALICYSTLQP